jgi:hypothetical protein
MRGIGGIGLSLLMLLAIASAAPALAQGQRIGQIKTATGQAFIVRGEARLPAKVGDPVYESDTIETGAPGSTIGITFIDNTVFSTGPETQVALSQFRFDSSNFKGEMLADVKKGSLSVVSGDITRSTPGAMKIKTPTAILGVSGTTFAVKVY